MLLNFDDAVDLERRGISVDDRGEIPTPNQMFLLKPDEEWTWEDLRDYIRWSELRFGKPMDILPGKERSMLQGFLKRWPDGKGIKIARYAIEYGGGRWNGYKVNSLSFRKDFDVEFAEQIIRLIER